MPIITLVIFQWKRILARYAGADTNAPELYNDANSSLEEVNTLWKGKAKEKAIEVQANKTIGIAANAEKISVEITSERRLRLDATKKTREINETKEALAVSEATKENLAEEVDKIRQEKNRLMRDFEAKNAQSNRLEQENWELKEKYNVAQSEFIRLTIENEKLNSTLFRLQGVIDFNNELPILENFLTTYGKVQRKQNGLVLTLPETIWLKPELEEISPEQIEKLQSLLKKIADFKYLQVTIYSYSAATGDLTAAQSFADNRAAAVEEQFIKNGIEKSRIQTKSFLQNQPVPTKKKVRVISLNRLEIELKPID